MSRCRLRTRGAVSAMLRLIFDFSTALRKAIRPLEEPAPIVIFSAALRNCAWLAMVDVRASRACQSCPEQGHTFLLLLD